MASLADRARVLEIYAMLGNAEDRIYEAIARAGRPVAVAEVCHTMSDLDAANRLVLHGRVTCRPDHHGRSCLELARTPAANLYHGPSRAS